MRIALKRRSAKWTVSFVTRGGIIAALLLVLINVSYVAAQAVREDPAKLWQNAVAGNLASFMHWRESGLLPTFAIVFAACLVLAIGHYFTFGPKDYAPKGPSDLIPWYNLFERILHAIVLITFIVLGITGMMLTYGRWIGGGSLGLFARQLHEISGFVYTPAIIIMVLMWIKNALPAAYDWDWLKHLGGYLGYKGSLKSGKFNAGQKLWFWIIALSGVVLIWTGLTLFFQSGVAPETGGHWASNGPFMVNVYEQTNALMYMRLYTMLHLIAAIPLLLFFIAHVYMSAVGAKGAIGAMINGKFSRTAALKFHSEAPDLKKMGGAPAGDDD